MELTQLRYFLEVAQSQHITKSAEKLHISQPSLTKAIHNLEHELEVPLFLPKGRNIVLSEYGKYLQKKLAPILAELDELPEKMQQIANIKNETIHLNVLAASTFLTQAIVEYKQLHPSIKFEFLQNSQEDLWDIQITTKLFYQFHSSEADRTFICNEKIYLAVPNAGRFRGRSGIHLSEVMAENFISLSDTRHFRIICDKICQRLGFRPNIVFESDSPAAVKNMIASGFGVGFWPEFTWGNVDAQQVLLLQIEDAACARDMIMTHKLNKLDNSNVVDFFQFLRDYFHREKQRIK